MTAPTWNLETMFPGGLAGETYTAQKDALRSELEAHVAASAALQPLPEGLDAYSALLRGLYRSVERMSALMLFAHCHTCADTQDRKAQQAVGSAYALLELYQQAWVPVSDHVARGTDAGFAALVAREELAMMGPTLHRMRAKGKLLLPREQQALYTELRRDSIQAWSRHYDRISGRLKVSLSDGQVLSVSRAKNLLSVEDADVREMAQSGLNDAWASIADDCATVLTHIVGTRAIVNARRGVDELADSLSDNHMKRESLEAMLEAARRAGPMLTRYLDVKAHLLGRERVRFSDLSAPVGTVGKMSWDAARSFVHTHFGSYHPELAALAQRAFSERWVEAEDRDNKRQGAWCGLVGSQPGVSRIFMTFGGTFRSTTTLAHELGHAFHNWALRNAHPSRREVPSTLAETASIFAENIIRDAALAAAQDRNSRLAMLDARLSAGVSFLMNLPFRFHLERDLYTLRQAGELDAAALCERTVHWQRDCYRDHLDSWYPHFWAEKLHFYMASRSFYNYPYTFGYLFSSLVYQRALSEGPGYHARYVELLERTGWQDAEPLVADLLGIDLTNPDDWYAGVAPLEADLAAFEKAAFEKAAFEKAEST